MSIPKWLRALQTDESADQPSVENPKDASGGASAQPPPPVSAEGLDIGQQALRQVFERMKIDVEWSVRGDRHFVWWMKDFAQGIRVSKPTLSHGIWIARLVARTTIGSDVPLNDDIYQRVSLANGYGMTLSALVLEDDGTLQLVTSAIVHEGTLWFVADQFAVAAAMQAADAQLKAWVAPKLIGGRVAASSHPTSGAREHMDDLGNIISGLVVPQGEGASQWAGAEMEEALAVLRKTSLSANGDSTGVTAEFPFGEYTSLLRLETTVKHPQVGSGLHVTLQLPFGPSEEAPPASATFLNRLEAYGAGALDFQGTWCVAPDKAANTITFAAFYPNLFCRNGMAANIALKMSRRAEWIASLVDGKTREGRWLLAQPALKRLIEKDSDAKVLQCESCNQVVIILSDLRCPNCGSEVRLPN